MLLYSHDSWGLGHLRRSLNLAFALGDRFREASVLLASGSPCATHFPLPPRTDVIKLPSVTKDRAGRYISRSLGLGRSALLGLRRDLLRGVTAEFRPDLLIVDHQAAGLMGEMRPALEWAKSNGVRTILGLRDVIDDPIAVERQWQEEHTAWALREAYDCICVYGVAEVMDPRTAYPMPREAAQRVCFSGYVTRPRSRPAANRDGRGPRVLVSTGGGEDGVERIHCYLDCLELDPVGWRSTIVTGPLMDSTQARRIARRAAGVPGVKVHRFYGDLPRLLSGSDVVVAMAGYNTAAEVLQSGRPVVYMPRVFPRSEQLIRAQRLTALGLADCVVDLDPRRLRTAVENAFGAKPSPGRIDLNGAARVAELTADLLSGADPSRQLHPDVRLAAS